MSVEGSVGGGVGGSDNISKGIEAADVEVVHIRGWYVESVPLNERGKSFQRSTLHGVSSCG